MRVAYICVLSALCLLTGIGLRAQTSHLFTSDRDLSSSLVNDLLIDSHGFLWVATEDGLNRYDGAKFTTYKTDSENKPTIADNFVKCVYEDAKGHILIGTYRGLQMYNFRTDDFSSLALAEDGKNVYNESVQRVVTLKDGRLLALGNEMRTVQISDDNVIRMLPFKTPQKFADTNAAIEDNDGNLWVSCNVDGLFRIDRKGRVKRFFGMEDTPIPDDFAVGDDGKLYIATNNRGLYVYDKKGDTVRPVLEDAFAKTLKIRHIIKGEENVLLLATDGMGLRHYNTKTKKLGGVSLPLYNDHLLKVHRLAKDAYGNLWAGLYQKGILVMPRESGGFRKINQDNPNMTPIGTSCITSLLSDSQGHLLVGTDNEGLYELEVDKHSSKHHANGLPPTIMALYEDSQKNVWVGSYGQGCGIFNSKTGGFSSIPLHNNKGVLGKNVYDFVEDNDRNVWIATMGHGLYRYNLDTRSVVYEMPMNNELNQWITSLAYSPKNNRVYLGTYNGMYYFSMKDKKLRVLLQNTIINKLYVDKKNGDLWLATMTGLYHLDAEAKVLSQYTAESGLPSNYVVSLEYTGDAVWASTTHGLSHLDIKTEKFTNFYVENGLQSNEFYKKTSCHDQNGNIYFGGINGLTMFNPKDVAMTGTKTAIRLTDFYVMGKAIRCETESGGRKIIDCPIFEARTFHLGHDENSFSVEFATDELKNSSHVTFLYTFDSDDWREIPSQQTNQLIMGGNTLNFTNVQSGSHTLRIKAVDNGVESDVMELSIYVAPAWYNTWWAWLIYIMIGAGFAYHVSRQLRTRAAQKRKEMERQHEVDIREAKLRFFTNISHEIRTPLSLVMSPLEKLMRTDGNQANLTAYRTMYRNAQRILRLVNELMDLRKIDNGKMRLHFVETPIEGFLQDIVDTFATAAEQKSIKLSLDCQCSEGQTVWIDHSNFDKIIVNLLSNAFKFTPQGGEITVRVRTEMNRSIAEAKLRNIDIMSITVTDTGIGIPDDDREHIFDRFYQGGHNIGGTGIGLHLTSLLVRLHHGEIIVAANPNGQGTRFTINLPLGDNHLTDEEKEQKEDTLMIQTEETATPLPEIPEDSEANENPENANKPKGSGKLVYVVEDDEDIRGYILENLGSHFRTRGFHNGEEALAAIHEQSPSLVITDVMMPGMDGYTLTQKIKQNVNLNHIPVIILTAKTQTEEQVEGLQAGADAYLTKPFNIDILRQTAHNLITLRQQLRNVYSGNQSQERNVEQLTMTSNDEKLMDKIMVIVNRNMSNADFTIEQLANEVGISRVHLHRKLKELTNQTSADFLRNLRLKQAANLLKKPGLTISEICYQVGFKHPTNFSVAFKQMYGMSPTAYAEANIGKEEGTPPAE